MFQGMRLVVVVLLGVALIGAVGAGGFLWYVSKQGPTPKLRTGPKPGAEEKEEDADRVGFGVKVHLLPVGPKDAARRPAAEVWQSLFTGMAADPDTKALLRKLYDGRPTALIVAPEEAAREQKAMNLASGRPPAGMVVALRVAADPKLEEEGGAYRGTMGYQRDAWLNPGDKSLEIVRLDKDGKVESILFPEERAVLPIAMNDYLLRTKAGWGAFLGGPGTPDAFRARASTGDVGAIRAEVDAQITDYLKRRVREK